jgi:drug/metabolite transporter (DMT)-like permease
MNYAARPPRITRLAALIAGVAYAELPFLLDRMSLGLGLWSIALILSAVSFVTAVLLVRRARDREDLFSLGVALALGVCIGDVADALFVLFFNPGGGSDPGGRLPPVEIAALLAIGSPGALVGGALGWFLGRRWRRKLSRPTGAGADGALAR